MGVATRHPAETEVQREVLVTDGITEVHRKQRVLVADTVTVFCRDLTVVVPIEELHVTRLGIGLYLLYSSGLGIGPGIVVDLLLALEDAHLLHVVSSCDGGGLP